MQNPLFFLILCTATLLSAAPPMIEMADNHKIGVQNAILAKVNGTTISMMDVKKKMDLLFHQNYPQLLNSSQARFQFYEASWRHVLMEMIDQELILADAADKEIKLTDGEVREEIENRFGPNVMTTLDKIGLSYDETWKLVKNEMIVRRMTWWFIHSKAMSKVTPQEIRQAYRNHIEANPAYSEWTYRVLTVKGENPAKASELLYEKIQQAAASPETLSSLFSELEESNPGISISLSGEYSAKDCELSESHRTALSQLTPGEYGHPISQISRDKKEVYRLFYLSAKNDHPTPSFEEISPVLKNEILQKTSAEISNNYLEKLRKHYRFDDSHLKESLPDDLTPFAIQ